MLRIIAAISVLSASFVPLHAHNLDTIATSISFSSDFVQTMSERASANQPLVNAGDEFWVLLKTTPGPGTDTGVGGYQTFYVPDGVEILNTAYVLPDPSDPRGFRNIPMKGQSPIAIGNGSIGAASSPELIGFDLPGVNGLGFDTEPVTATGAHRGTLAGVYADTGIFYSTDPRTAFNSYGTLQPPLVGPPSPMKNNSGDTVGEYFASNVPNSATRKVLGVMSLWDSHQLRAYGRSDDSPLLDSNGRGTAPWGLANVVAGPQSGYAWEFDYDAYADAAGTNAQKIQAAIKIGPWNRIKYPGSQISSDQPGLISNTLGQAGVDASFMGIDPSEIPAGTNAVRFAIGQLELGRPEYSAVKIRINETPGAGDCQILNADAFGGDAGGTEGGKDHIWRYFDPTVVSLNPCTFLQKVASKSLVAPGETFYYDITFANNGTLDLPNFTLTDVLPNGITHVSASPAQSTVSGQTLTWNFGTVEAGEFITIRHYVKATGSGTLFNTATARSGINVVGVAQASVEVGVRAILEKNKTVTPSAVAPGETVTYTLNIENLGTGNNGVPMTVREYLPPGFTFVSLQGATLNGATISSPTIATNSSNPARPVFTVNQGIQPGKKLMIRFNALVGANVHPGTYWNSFQLEYEGKIVPPIPEAPVIVAGGKIGDTVWRDWNGNGVQDAGESGFPGVTVELYAADGTTLLRTTTTDSGGNYHFPGLVAGSYVVKVAQPASTTQTGDPDGTLDNSHAVNLATDQQYLAADFGYRPTGAGSIGDLVFEDTGNDGVFSSGIDTGISGVNVLLYADINSDGVVKPGVDALISSTTTNGGGVYSFTGLATGFSYLAAVDPADPSLAAYFGVDPFQTSSANPQAVTNLTGSYLAADFGFWRVAPGSIGDQVFIDADGNGLYNPATDSPLGGVTVTLLLDGSTVASAVTTPDGTYLFANLGPGTYRVVVNASSIGVPSGHSPSVAQHSVNLSAGQDFLTADFPFTPLIAKSVDQAFAEAGDSLSFGVSANYPGSTLLTDVTVRDFLPGGTSFTSAGQGGILETFASAPGSVGIGTYGESVARVYAFRGGSSSGFRAYDPGANTWTPLANAPAGVGAGAALTNDGARYIYALRGAGTRAFWRFDAVEGVWSDAAVADLPGGAPTVGDGGALAHVEGFVYALLGGGSNQFWRYEVASNTWTAQTNLSFAVGAGGSLAADGIYIYAMRGADTRDFARYDTESNTWLAREQAGRNVAEGAGLAAGSDGFIYATEGNGGNRFYRYNQDTDTWGEAALRDFTPDTGGALATDGTNFFALQGNNTTGFVNRSFTAATTSLAASPAAVNAGGALTYLQMPAEVTRNEISVSDNVVAVGTPVTVTMTLESSEALAGVVPGVLTVHGGGATVSAPSPASLDLAVNVPAQITWTVTPLRAGEFCFEASAGNGTVEFESALSETFLASPDGQDSYVVWNLGSNESGSTGVTALSKNFYAFQGNTSPSFWAFNTTGSQWNNPVNPANPAVNIQAGGALTNDGRRYIYAIQGIGATGLLRFDTSTDAWNAVVPAEPPTPDAVPGPGTALAYLDGSVYIAIGNGSAQLWRYDVGSNTISQMANAPGTIGEGGALATDGNNLYALRGLGSKTFWRYNVGSNTWSVLAPVAQNVKRGGSLVYANGAIYALRGDAKKDFWRYNIVTNTWSARALTPENVRQGGSLAFDGTAIYAFRGDSKTDFWKYNTTSDIWTISPVAPGTVGWGGALTYLATGDVSVTSLQAFPTLISGVRDVTVRMTVSSDDAISGVSASTPPSYTATGGATAVFGPATLVSADNNIGGTGDPVVYQWIATVTPGASPGDITFSATSSVGAQAVSNSVIATPVLTYDTLVGVNPPAVIRNTALIHETDGTIYNVPSNTTETATSGSIGDFVWADLNADGLQDAGEYGLGGVTVNLYAADGVTFLATEVTDASGAYRFFGLTAGDYVVSYDDSTAPAGYFETTPITVPVSLTTGQQFDAADFGLTQPPSGTGSIGDYVWIDANNDGIQDEGEAALPGVTVILERLINGNWVAVSSAVTDTNGAYAFTGLSAASFRVTVDSGSQISSPYAQGTFALGDVMAPTFDRDGTATPNVALVTLATDSTVITNADFGYNWSGSIGDFVWWDQNTNGLQDEAPLEGIANARVQLYFDQDFDGVFNRILGDYEILRVFTDANGAYVIPNLPPGNYFVDVYEDSITTGGVRDIVPTTVDIIPANLSPASMNVDTADFGYYEGARVEATVFWDANHNGIRDAEPLLANITVNLTGTNTLGDPVSQTALTDANGNVAFLVPEGDYTISYENADITANYPALGTPTTPLSFEFTAVAGDDGIKRFDFGVDNTGAIGDTVFADIDGDGSQSGSEPGLADVTVNLYLDVDGNGIIDFGAGDLLLETTLTDANGNYSFGGLEDTGGTSRYLVEVLASTLPEGYETEPTAYPVGADVSNSRYSTALTNGEAIDIVDFGYPPVPDVYFTVSGTIYHDNGDGGGASSDGQMNGTEPGLGNVSVRIEVDADGDGSYGHTYNIPTDANGFYSLGGIPEGADVRITVIEGTLPNKAFGQTGDPDGGALSNIWLIADLAADAPDINFGYLESLGSIAGTIVQGDGDGTAEPGEPVRAGVTVTATYSGPDGIPGNGDDEVFTTTTDANGDYSFTDLLPGNYVITTDIPDGFHEYADADGFNPNSIDLTLPVGADVTDRDFEYQSASLSGYVWTDANADAVRGGSEPVLESITVFLDLDGNGAPDPGEPSTVTDASGFYEFTGLDSGSHNVRVDPTGLPTGSFQSYDIDGLGTPNLGVVTLAPNDDTTDVDFGYYLHGSITGSVLTEVSGDPIPDVTLSLLDAAGAPVLDGMGAPIATVTAANGSYSFGGLRPGDYQVLETQPSGYYSISDKDGGDKDLIGDVTLIGVLSGETNSGNDFIEEIGTCIPTWAVWKQLHPGEEADGNPEADFHDNLNEFAFAMDPYSGAGDAYRIQPSAITPGTIDAVFIRPIGAVDNVVYTLQYAAATGNPTAWSSIEITPSMYVSEPFGTCLEKITITNLETLTTLTGGTGIVRIRTDLDEENDTTVDHTAHTGVEGWKRTPFGICCQTYNTPYLTDTVFTGVVSAGGISGQTVDLSGSAVATDLATLLSAPGATYFLEITDGPGEGNRYDIDSASGSTVTLANDSSLSAAGAPYNTVTGAPYGFEGSSIVIRRHRTVAELFPPSDFVASTDQAQADEIQIYAGGAWTILHLYDDSGTPRWVDNFNSLIDQGGIIIAPGQGLFLNNRNSPKNLLAYGEVRENDFIRPLAAGSNLVGGGYPLSQSATGAGSRAMTLSNGFFGSKDFKTADSFFVWKGDTTPGLSAYDSYYLLNGAPQSPSLIRWVKVGDATLLARDSAVLLLDNRAVFTRSALGAPAYVYPAPWLADPPAP